RFATTRSAIGEFSTEGQIEGRIAVFEKITLSGVGGTGHGHATIDLDDPNRTTALLEWSNLDGARLGELLPALAGLAGTYSGDVAIAPATDPRAIEPLRVTVGLTPISPAGAAPPAKFRTLD